MIFRVKSHSIDASVPIQLTRWCLVDWLQRFDEEHCKNSHSQTFDLQNTLKTVEHIVFTLYVKLTFREEHCNNSHSQTFDLPNIRKQLNTRLLVDNSTCKLIICTKLERSTLCFHWKYSFPCNFKFCAGLGSSCHPTDLASGTSGGPICTAQ